MEALKHNCKDDLGSSSVYPGQQDWRTALGEWFNFDKNTKQITRVNIYVEEGRLHMEAFSAESEWGTAPVEIFTSGVHSGVTEGFTGTYDFGFKETHFCTLFKYGTLVIQTYNLFKDGSGRPNYFLREFFHQVNH